MYSEFKTKEWERYFLDIKQKLEASENDNLLSYIREVVLLREESYLSGVNISKLNEQKESLNHDDIVEKVVKEALVKHEEAFIGRVVDGLSISLNAESVSIDYELISTKVVEKIKASIPKKKMTQDIKVEQVKHANQDKSFLERFKRGWTAFRQGV